MRLPGAIRRRRIGEGPAGAVLRNLLLDMYDRNQEERRRARGQPSVDEPAHRLGELIGVPSYGRTVFTVTFAERTVEPSVCTSVAHSVCGPAGRMNGVHAYRNGQLKSELCSA